MKADIVPFRGLDFAELEAGEHRLMHYTPPGKDELVCLQLTAMNGLCVLYLPGEQIVLLMGNVELTMTVTEWEALKPKVETVINAGRINAEAAMIDNTPTRAFEL